MKKILFVAASLRIGGMERVLVDIANELIKDYDITIFTIYLKLEKNCPIFIVNIALINGKPVVLRELCIAIMLAER